MEWNVESNKDARLIWWSECDGKGINPGITSGLWMRAHPRRSWKYVEHVCCTCWDWQRCRALLCAALRCVPLFIMSYWANQIYMSKQASSGCAVLCATKCRHRNTSTNKLEHAHMRLAISIRQSAWWGLGTHFCQHNKHRRQSMQRTDTVYPWERPCYSANSADFHLEAMNLFIFDGN